MKRLPGLGGRNWRSRRGGACCLHGDKGRRMKKKGNPGDTVLRLKTSPETPPAGEDQEVTERGRRQTDRRSEEETNRG